MNEKNEKKLQYSVMIQTQLAEMLQDENCNNYIEDWQDNLTEFFTATIIAISNLHNRITGDKKNYLEFSYLVNQLIVQHIIEQREDKTGNSNL